MTLSVGDTAPDFTLKNQHGQEVSLSGLRGRPVAVVFFPFAFTGICTGELCEIRDNIGAFASDDAQVLGISCDTTAALRVFAEQEGLEFPLLSDFWPHGKVASQYGVLLEERGAVAVLTLNRPQALNALNEALIAELNEALAGFEYNADCWVGRLVFHTFAVAPGQQTRGIFLQLELNGFSRIGSNPLDTLRRAIPGYMRLNQTLNPGRTGDYDDY